ncbi:CheY-like chemotaxis protein [Novosphingobium chloroacetimidivorans]|uniref:CheY-like chemotaxis protein n=1 Tax=Novosphingobium chloroacetimidivorans TaxID=1428314 RepID=A0A7W7KBL5_9SPHN|nr:hypothetical protein [Novosphingobium chloroacetimidivorans]MBB4859590.1 CheY-like chemotaxis protein [Novosphingobium chloroacetimidivorans]
MFLVLLYSVIASRGVQISDTPQGSPTMQNHGLSIQDAPFVLLVARDLSRTAQLREELQAAGWRVDRATDAAEARKIAAAETVAVLIVDLADSPDDGEIAAGTLRGVTGPSHAAPILALAVQSERQTDPKSSRVDGLLPSCPSGNAIVRALEDWRPVSLEPTRRIVAMFGSGPIAGMMQRLALRLEAALAQLERGTFDKAEAHRLAGLCGTLGFAQAHAAWLDLSLGEKTVLTEARRTTRLTLAAIARGL